MKTNFNFKIVCEREGWHPSHTSDRESMEWGHVKEPIFATVIALLRHGSRLDAEEAAALAQSIQETLEEFGHKRRDGETPASPSINGGESRVNHGEPDAPAKFVGRDEAARILGVTPDHVTELARLQKLKKYTGRDGNSLYRVEELKDYRKRTKRRGVTGRGNILGFSSAARHLHISESYLERLVLAGEIPVRDWKKGEEIKFNRRDLDRWLVEYRENVNRPLTLS